MPQQVRYANVINAQINPNLTKENTWSNLNNAVGGTEKYATSHYTAKLVGYETYKSGAKKGQPNKKKPIVETKYPYKLTAHDFKFDIPSNAYIKKITVRTSLKTNDKYFAHYPAIGFYIKDRKSTGVKNADRFETGWHNGVYWAYNFDKLTTTFHPRDYVMGESDYHKGGFSVSDLNSDYFGVDLNFFLYNIPSDQTIYLKYVKITIDYDVPTYKVTELSHQNNPKPLQLRTGDVTPCTFSFQQLTKANGGSQQLRLNIPYGVEISNITCGGNSSYSNGVWTVPANGVTTSFLMFKFVDYTVNAQEITLKPVSNTDIPSCSLPFNTVRGLSDDYTDGVNIQYASSHKPHKLHTSCWNATARGVSSNNTLNLYFKNSEDCIINSLALDYGTTSSSVSFVSATIGSATYTGEGSYPLSANTYGYVTLSVPDNNEQFEVGLDICLQPKKANDPTYDTDITTLTVKFGENESLKNTYDYFVESPFVYHFGRTDNDTDTDWHEMFIGETTTFTNHRIASNIETGAFILPCGVKDGDAVMIEGKSAINMYKWEEVDYIGCVPVEHYHFDPKSTYKDTLLDTHYKNKRYMGKQLAPDEDITLNIRLHPEQVTTMQGLIDMDKPIPINANHRCFEGDALNHRGWAEIYGIKAEKTNTHWYKCDIDVKYLTHNLNTRFHIEKGSSTFERYHPIPSLLAEVKSSGSVIGTNQEEDFFIVDTDGTYNFIEDDGKFEIYYDYEGNSINWLGEDANHTIYVKANDDPESTTSIAKTMTGKELFAYLEEYGYVMDTLTLNQPIKVWESYNSPLELKNRFTIDEGQHISVKSRNPLSTVSEISFNWLSSKLVENKENQISRIVRLINADTGDVAFEYEYCDFDFEGYQDYVNVEDNSSIGILSCRVIGRVRDNEDYRIAIEDEINLITDLDSIDDTYVDPDTQQTINGLDYFGSKVHFYVNNGTLKVTDEGYNGREISSDNIKLQGNKFYYEAYWQNKNTDGENDDIIAYFDVAVQDSVLETTYGDKYATMYVSPFPVKDKRILFTRKAEEGFIYYLEDNKEEFTYLIDPYYQYHNGVDLRNSKGGSIFNLNYGYKNVYLENGLVSLGINRLNGRMYLRRYDDNIKQYIQLFDLQLSKYDDVNINAISDDRIELQASDTTIIMYRGHPYVIFKHELEDINITSTFKKVYGESVDGEASSFPIYYDLMNHSNLLPACVTTKLNDDCVTLLEHDMSEDELTTVTLSTSGITGKVYEGDTKTVTVTGHPSGSEVSLMVMLDKGEKGFEDDTYELIESNTSGSFNYKFNTTGNYQFMFAYLGDDIHYPAYSAPFAVTVEAKMTEQEIEEYKEEHGGVIPAPEQITGSWKLSMDAPSTMTYRDGSKVKFTLTKGGVPVSGEVIEMIDFTTMNTATTGDTNKGYGTGEAWFLNTRNSSHPQKWKLGAKFTAIGSRVTASVYKTITVKKATPEFHIVHQATKSEPYVTAKLRAKVNGSWEGLKGKKVHIVYGSKTYNRVTNDKGNESLTGLKKGTHKIKFVFDGDKDYKKCELTYRVVIK